MAHEIQPSVRLPLGTHVQYVFQHIPMMTRHKVLHFSPISLSKICHVFHISTSVLHTLLLLYAHSYTGVLMGFVVDCVL